MGIVQPSPVTLRDGSTVTIRSALAEDAAAVIDAAKRIFGQTDMVLTQPDEFTISVEDEEALLGKRAESATGLYVIAEVSATSHGPEGRATKIIAIAGLDPASRRRVMHNVTLGIMVDSVWHKRGVGDAMMAALMGWARANSAVRRVQLEVVASNAHAVRLYARHGFVTEGRRRGVFQRQPGVFEDDLIMACDVAAGR
ncbi:MAG TPA: GNAT family N-acetyltransferase [Phycisphaerales bacterium]|nr:GNAT family N-acetyltransferase [Phycisphaerales bacterium]